MENKCYCVGTSVIDFLYACCSLFASKPNIDIVKSHRDYGGKCFSFFFLLLLTKTGFPVPTKHNDVARKCCWVKIRNKF